jgi:hypothetical protein
MPTQSTVYTQFQTAQYHNNYLLNTLPPSNLKPDCAIADALHRGKFTIAAMPDAERIPQSLITVIRKCNY